MDVASKKTMERNGWKVETDHSNGDDPNQITNEKNCSPDTFYGYRSNDTVGRVSATFMGSGKAKLLYGNCDKNGYVIVGLNC